MSIENSSLASRVVLLIFLAVALYASYSLIKPFIEPIVLAILVGMLAHPLHHRIVQALGGRESTAALVTSLLLCLGILLPMIALLAAVLDQGVKYSAVVRDWVTSDNMHAFMQQPTVVKIQSWLTRVLPEGALELESIREKALSTASSLGGKFAGISTALLGGVTSFFIKFFLLLFVLFFVLRDHDRLIAFLHHALPLSRSQENTLFREVRAVSKSALLGSLLTAVTQGIAGGIALSLAGFPGVFWGTVMAFASLIPFVGTAIIWVPAAAYLALTGETGWALFMVVWCVVVVGSIDNFLRPLFMQGASMSTVVVFFSLLGGLQVFGLMGLVYGPLIFAIALVLFKMYEEEFSDFLDSQDNR
jgi:predicted PurR-regulated permease PerM